jgi:hypothetical protein
MRGHTEPGRDVFGTKPAFLRQLLERLELVGRMQALGYASTVLLAVWR